MSLTPLPQPTSHIMIVDDDREIVRLLQAYLEQANFQAISAYDGATALRILQSERPALVLLDLMLPDRSGWDITRLIRSDPNLSAIPIIMITARVEETDKIVGLELGADDYITKPFSPREVVARVRSVLRRTQPGETVDIRTTLQWGPFSMDLAKHNFLIDGQSVDLTRTEFDLMKVLLSSPGRVFTRADLIEKVYGHDYESLERGLDSHIKNLRRKIEPDPRQPQYLQTVYGVGYQLGTYSA